MIAKKHLCRIFLAVLLVLCVNPPAQAGLLEFLFPSLRDAGPDPSETLQAPFAYDPAKPADDANPAEAVLPLPENMVPLDQAHASTAHLADWLMTAVSGLMTLDEAYERTLAGNAGYFSAAGQQQYRAFLEQNDILKTLSSGSYRINSVVTARPVLLNEGVVAGRYRWLFEVNVLTTYMDRSANSYKRIKPVTQSASLVIQVGRMEKATKDQSVVIERWTGKTAPLPKN